MDITVTQSAETKPVHRARKIWDAARDMSLRVTLMSLLVTLLLVTHVAFAANHYILPTGSGSETGADWNNSCAGFSGGAGDACVPSSMVRGDTYYVGTGTYSLAVFNTPESGTSVITVKGATAADHGTNTGWSTSYGVDVTPATFTTTGSYLPIGIFVWNGYLVLDGNTGPGCEGTSSSCGFTVSLPASCSNGNSSVEIGRGGTTVNNVQISHFYFIACGSDVQTQGITLQGATTSSNDYYSYNFFNGFQVVFADHSTASTFDHNYLINAADFTDHHGNQFDFGDGETNAVISNNLILGCAGTVCLGANDSGTTCVTGLKGPVIYGNVFNVNSSLGVGDGIIGSTTQCFMQNALIYNNSFLNSTSGFVQGCVTSAPTCANATGNLVENSIVYNSNCNLGSGIGTHDYNSYLHCSSGTAPTETHGEVASFNPFVNSAANNYLPSAAAVSSCSSATATCVGLTLSSPYTIDPNGTNRILDGPWERGAYQFEPATEPQPPSQLPPLVVQSQ